MPRCFQILPSEPRRFSVTQYGGILISAEDDFDIAANHHHLRQLFGHTTYRQATAIYTAYIFICPETPCALPEWLSGSPEVSAQFRQAMQELVDGKKSGRQFIDELLRLCDDYPRETALFLLSSKSFYKEIIRNDRLTTATQCHE